MPGRSIAKTRKRNKKAKAANAYHAKRMQQKKIAGELALLQHAGPTLPETATVDNLTEPLLEIFKEEPQLQQVSEESLPDVGTNPAGSDAIPDVSLFCSLCLRPCTSGQVAEFSTEPSGRDKLALLQGVEIELEQCAICRPCWTLLEMFADFREGCLKASAWKARFSLGLDGAGDDWLSKENLEVMARTRKVVQEHVKRIEMARNRHALYSDELPEEKPILADSQHLEEDLNYPLLMEEPPNHNSSTRAAEILDQTEKTTFSCEKCQRRFETKLSIALHLRHCSRSSKIKPKLYTCSICLVSFMDSYRLREHRNKHMGIKLYECRRKDCNKRFYGTHERFHHEKKCEGSKSLNPSVELESSASLTSKLQDQLEIYSCSKCPCKFGSKEGLVNHTVKPGIKQFKCENKGCDMHFYGNSELQRHATRCGKRDKPVCPVCGIQLALKKTLKAHMKIHEKQNNTCNDCDKVFSSAHLLNVHRQQIHTQEKGFISFICSICGQEFEYSLLVQHMEKCHARKD